MILTSETAAAFCVDPDVMNLRRDAARRDVRRVFALASVPAAASRPVR